MARGAADHSASWVFNPGSLAMELTHRVHRVINPHKELRQGFKFGGGIREAQENGIEVRAQVLEKGPEWSTSAPCSYIDLHSNLHTQSFLESLLSHLRLNLTLY